MQPVTIYTKSTCGYCQRAKSLLTQKNAPFEEISVDAGGPKLQEMTQRANGGYTVPQIFIGDRHIGGSDALHALERAGELDALLNG